MPSATCARSARSPVSWTWSRPRTPRSGVDAVLGEPPPEAVSRVQLPPGRCRVGVLSGGGRVAAAVAAGLRGPPRSRGDRDRRAAVAAVVASCGPARVAAVVAVAPGPGRCGCRGPTWRTPWRLARLLVARRSGPRSAWSGRGRGRGRLSRCDSTRPLARLRHRGRWPLRRLAGTPGGRGLRGRLGAGSAAAVEAAGDGTGSVGVAGCELRPARTGDRYRRPGRAAVVGSCRAWSARAPSWAAVARPVARPVAAAASRGGPGRRRDDDESGTPQRTRRRPGSVTGSPRPRRRPRRPGPDPRPWQAPPAPRAAVGALLRDWPSTMSGRRR